MRSAQFCNDLHPDIQLALVRALVAADGGRLLLASSAGSSAPLGAAVGDPFARALVAAGGQAALRAILDACPGAPLLLPGPTANDPGGSECCRRIIRYPLADRLLFSEPARANAQAASIETLLRELVRNADAPAALVFIRSPGDPIGAPWRPGLVQDMCARWPGVWFVVDESAAPAGSCAAVGAPNLAVIQDFGPRFGLVGLPVARVVLGNDLRRVRLESCAASPLARVAAEALLTRHVYFEERLARGLELAQTLAQAAQGERVAAVPPHSAFCVLRFAGDGAQEFLRALEGHRDIAADCGRLMGLRQCVRVAPRDHRDLEAALQALRAVQAAPAPRAPSPPLLLQYTPKAEIACLYRALGSVVRAMAAGGLACWLEHETLAAWGRRKALAPWAHRACVGYLVGETGPWEIREEFERAGVSLRKPRAGFGWEAASRRDPHSGHSESFVALIPFAAVGDGFVCQDPRLQHETPGAADSYHTRYRSGELFPLGPAEVGCLRCFVPREFGAALDRAVGPDWRTRVRRGNAVHEIDGHRPASPA